MWMFVLVLACGQSGWCAPVDRKARQIDETTVCQGNTAGCQCLVSIGLIDCTESKVMPELTPTQREWVRTLVMNGVGYILEGMTKERYPVLESLDIRNSPNCLMGNNWVKVYQDERCSLSTTSTTGGLSPTSSTTTLLRSTTSVTTTTTMRMPLPTQARRPIINFVSSTTMNPNSTQNIAPYRTTSPPEPAAENEDGLIFKITLAAGILSVQVPVFGGVVYLCVRYRRRQRQLVVENSEEVELYNQSSAILEPLNADEVENLGPTTCPTCLTCPCVKTHSKSE